MIPALNEESSIKRVILYCKHFGDVLVVNDGSIDNTRENAQKAGAKLINNMVNRGYEYSLNKGYKYACDQDYDIMITIDADGQLPTHKIPDFLLALSEGSSLVVGARKKLTRVSERLLAFCSQKICDIRDPFCGMKAYDLNAFKEKKFSRYNSTGTCLAFKYVSLGYRVTNLEIETTERQGKSKFGGVFISELRLLPSLLIGCLYLLRILLY